MRSIRLRYMYIIIQSLLCLAFFSVSAYALESGEIYTNLESLLLNLEKSGVNVTAINDNKIEFVSLMYEDAELLSNDYVDYLEVDVDIYRGIGIQSVRKPDGSVYIGMVLEGNAADRAGLIEGDKIVEIAGLSSYGSVQDQITAIKNLPNSKYTFTILRNNEQLKKIVETETIIYGGVNGKMLNQETAYVQLDDIEFGAADAFGKAMDALDQTGMKNMVLDLRGTYGLNLGEAEGIAERLLPKGTPIYKSYNKNGIDEYYVKTGDDTPVRLVVITNQRTREAGAVLAYGIQKAGVGTHIGEGLNSSIYGAKYIKLENDEGYLRLLVKPFWSDVNTETSLLLKPGIEIRTNHYADVPDENNEVYVDFFNRLVSYKLGDSDPLVEFAEDQLYYLGLYNGLADEVLDKNTFDILQMNGFLTNGALTSDGLSKLNYASASKWKLQNTTGDLLINEAVKLFAN